MCKKWNSSFKQEILGDSRKRLTCYEYLRKKSIESKVAWVPLFLDPLPSSPPHWHQIRLWEWGLRCLHCHGVPIRPEDQEDPVSFALAQALLERMQNLHFLPLCPPPLSRCPCTHTASGPALLWLPMLQIFPMDFLPIRVYLSCVPVSRGHSVLLYRYLLCFWADLRLRAREEWVYTQRSDVLSWQKV